MRKSTYFAAVIGAVMGISIGATGVILIFPSMHSHRSEIPHAPATPPAVKPELVKQNSESDRTKPVLPADLGFGFTVPLGQSLEDFQKANSDIVCTDNGKETACAFSDPSREVCPNHEPCEEPLYFFLNGKLNGFTARYDERTWARLLHSARDAFGPERERKVRPVRGPDFNEDHGGDVSEWEITTGSLNFTHYITIDMRTASISAYAYGIAFGPPEDVERDLVQ